MVVKGGGIQHGRRAEKGLFGELLDRLSQVLCDGTKAIVSKGKVDRGAVVHLISLLYWAKSCECNYCCTALCWLKKIITASKNAFIYFNRRYLAFSSFFFFFLSETEADGYCSFLPVLNLNHEIGDLSTGKAKEYLKLASWLLKKLSWLT